MAPRSPYKGNNSFKDTLNTDSLGGHFGLTIKYVSQQNNQLLNCCAVCLYINNTSLYQSSQNARDSARFLLLHQSVQDLPSTAVGRQRALGLIHFLPHFPYNFLSFVI